MIGTLASGGLILAEQQRHRGWDRIWPQSLPRRRVPRTTATPWFCLLKNASQWVTSRLTNRGVWLKMAAFLGKVLLGPLPRCSTRPCNSMASSLVIKLGDCCLWSLIKGHKGLSFWRKWLIEVNSTQKHAWFWKGFFQDGVQRAETLSVLPRNLPEIWPGWEIKPSKFSTNPSWSPTISSD